jgi:hypothetical protein
MPVFLENKKGGKKSLVLRQVIKLLQNQRSQSACSAAIFL